jgi:hypothetical protein
MHIELDQSTQLVAANRTRKWFPEEKDWVLNKVMNRFIESSLIRKPDGSGGFELDQSKVDGIKNLIRSKQPLIAWIDSPDRYKAYLPADYLHLLSDSSFTQANCGAPDPSTTTVTHYITRLLSSKSAKPGPSYYQTLDLVMGGKTVKIPADLPYNNEYVGYPEKNDISFLVPYLLSKTGLYWERFGDVYHPGQFIAVSQSPIAAPTLKIDGTTFNSVTASSFTLTRHEDVSSKMRNNRLTASNLVPAMRSTSFFKSSSISPISELENNILWIYRDKSFTVSRIEVSYIRRPQPISLSLGTDCELGETVHQKICDLAVEYLQSRNKDVKGVQMSEADISKRIIL